MKKTTIYEELKARLGREPTNEEIKNECKRIIGDAYALVKQSKRR